MKKSLRNVTILLVTMFLFPLVGQSQAPTGNVVNVQTHKMKRPENGSVEARDSLLAIYFNMVVKKNEFILSHREYRHMFTASNNDYLVITEYKDLASMEKAFERTDALEKEAWPDEAKAKAYFDALGAYFENWHGDALYTTNEALNKN